MANIDDVEEMVDRELFVNCRTALIDIIDALQPLPIDEQKKVIISAKIFLGHHGEMPFFESHDEHGDDLPTRALPGGPPYPKKRDPA